MHSDEKVQSLFRKWRKGDSEAGDAMAYRFEQWFRALSINHLGGSHKKSYEDSCKKFSQGIEKVDRPTELIGFAYKIISTGIGGSNNSDGEEYTNAMLQSRSPRELIQAVWGDLSPDDKGLLMAGYANKEPLKGFTDITAGQGGVPYALLKARHRLKKQLHEKSSVPFSMMATDWDLCPLPLYEGRQLGNTDEIERFERWLLTSPQICQDIIEFSPFVHSLRNGDFASEEAAASEEESPPDEEVTVVENTSPTGPIPHEEESSLFKWILLGVILAFLLSGIYVIAKHLLAGEAS
jgi:hypothetical protein